MIAPIRSEIRLRDALLSLFGPRGSRDLLAAELARYFGVGYVLLTHSGRSALYYLLRALPQQKVFLPAYNCWAVPQAVRYAGKQAEFVDIAPDDYNMDPARLAEVLTPGSIILATHQFGIPCDLAALQALAAERDCLVIEDNAAGFGAEIGGRKTGSLAAAGILSFEFGKTLVAGRGGAILFNDAELYRRVSELHRRETRPAGAPVALRSLLTALAYSWATHPLVYPLTHALVKKARGSYRSVKKCHLDHRAAYRLGFDDIRARLARRNFRRLEQILARRAAIAASYLEDPELAAAVVLPRLHEGTRALPIKLPFRPRGFDAEGFQAACRERGVDLAHLFPYHYLKDRVAASAAAGAAGEALALPVYSTLGDRQLARVKRAVCAAARLAGAHVERRRFGCFSLCYYWLDTPAFRASRERIALLRSYDELPADAYHLKFRYRTFLIDLGQSTEEIYAAFAAKSAKYCINRALKCGVEVRQARTEAEKLRFFDFYREFAADPKRKDKMLVLQRGELAGLRIFQAFSRDGDYLGGIGLLPAPDGSSLLYKYAATLHLSNENELLIWEAIRYAREQGFRSFDMSWMTLSEDKQSDSYRLYQFKRKFGGELVDFYTYVRFSGLLGLLAKPFDIILKRLFDDDINQFALFLKKLKIFR